MFLCAVTGMTRLTVISQHRHVCSLRRNLDLHYPAPPHDSCLIVSDFSHLRAILGDLQRFNGDGDEAKESRRKLDEMLVNMRKEASDEMKRESSGSSAGRTPRLARRGSTRSIASVPESSQSESDKDSGKKQRTRGGRKVAKKASSSDASEDGQRMSFFGASCTLFCTCPVRLLGGLLFLSECLAGRSQALQEQAEILGFQIFGCGCALHHQR